MNKKIIKQGFLFGIITSFVLLSLVVLFEYDGKCGLSVMGGANERYVCTLPEYLFFDSNGLILTVQLAIYYFWWVLPIVFILSILGTYVFLKRKIN